MAARLIGTMRTYHSIFAATGAALRRVLPLMVIAVLFTGCGSSSDHDDDECCPPSIHERAIGVLLTDAWDGIPMVNAAVLITDANGYYRDVVVRTDGSGYAGRSVETDGIHDPAWLVYIDMPGYHPYTSAVLQTGPGRPSIVLDIALEPY